MDAKHDCGEEWKEASISHKGKTEVTGKFIFQQMSYEKLNFKA
jgi:hypothetical protein